jgi:hypothetical protein
MTVIIKAQGETQMQTQEADGWSLTMFVNPKGGGKRMIIDRQKGHSDLEYDVLIYWI